MERLEPPVDHPPHRCTLDDDAGALFDPADAAEEELAATSNSASSAARLLGRKRDEQAARGLRVVAERDERLGHPVAA